MFSSDIVTSDKFLDMPGDSQLLYFHLGIQADDDGFVAPKKVTRMIGAQDDSLKLLIGKGFLIPFQSGVIVIRHWREHNSIRVDRYQPTSYADEKRTLTLDGRTYNVLQDGNQPATIGRASKEVRKEGIKDTPLKQELTEEEIKKRFEDGRQALFRSKAA